MAHPDLEARLHLLNHNREAVSVMLATSGASGLAVDDTVAIVADTTDSVGGPMARAMAERGDGLDADAEAARTQARGEIPTLVAIVTVKVAVEVFRMPNPTLSGNIGAAGRPRSSPRGRRRGGRVDLAGRARGEAGGTGERVRARRCAGRRASRVAHRKSIVVEMICEHSRRAGERRS